METLKVGDKVTLRERLEDNKYYGSNTYAHPDMFFKNEREIVSILKNGEYRLKGEEFYDYTKEMLNKVKEKKMETKKSIECTLEQAREIYGKNDTMDKLLLFNFTEKELMKRKLPKSWEEIEYQDLSGWMVRENSEIIPVDIYLSKDHTDRNIFKTEKQAKSSLAMAQLSQLLYVYNEGKEIVPSDTCDTFASIILPNTNKHLEINRINRKFAHNYFLIFPDSETAEEFLKNFEDLIKDYCMLN